MEWLQNNLMVIIFYCFIIYMFGKISFQIYRTINKAKEGDMTNELPECTPLIAQYILNDGIINENAIKAVFLQLCKNNFIILNPVINEKDEIVDYELIKNNVPNFKEKDYEILYVTGKFSYEEISKLREYVERKSLSRRHAICAFKNYMFECDKSIIHGNGNTIGNMYVEKKESNLTRKLTQSKKYIK